MKNIFFLLALVAVLFTGCKTKSEIKTTFNISGTISNTDVDSLTIYDGSRNELVKIAIGEGGNFTGNVLSSAYGYNMIRVGREFGNFYAAPGDLIEISLDAQDFDATIDFSGDHAQENNYLAQKTLMDIAQEQTYGLRTIAKLNQEEFYNKLQEKYAQNFDILEEALDNNADEKFLVLERKSLEMDGILDKLTFPRAHNSLNKTELEFGDDYYSFMEEVSLDDEDAINTPAGMSVLVSKIERMAPKSDYDMDGPVDFFLGQLKKVRNNVSSKLVQEKLFHKLLNEKINFGGGLDGITDEVDFYNKLSTNAKQKENLAKMVTSWETIKAGNNAPPFSGVTRAGEKVQLADLKGKNVYVDVWATWCGPCKAEIPSLKAVEKEYHGKNIEFVSISIDDLKDKEEWAQFIVDNNLGGTQIFAENAWESEITKGYNIRGIPRFILIDAEGKIVSADAPRPSNERLKKVFDETLEKS